MYVPRFKSLVHFMRYKHQWIRASRYFADAERDDLPERLKRNFAAFASKNKNKRCFYLKKQTDAGNLRRSPWAEDRFEQAVQAVSERTE